METTQSEESVMVEKIKKNFSKLTPFEQQRLEDAARGYFYGGDPLTGKLKVTAVKMELAYECSGKLRPHVYKKIRSGELPTPNDSIPA